MKSVAVIGLGIMGHGIADNFLKNGYQVTIWNRSKSRTKDLLVKGAELASSPKEAAQKADIIFEVTADDESSQAVWLGKNGILEGSRPKQFVIACSTLSVDWVNRLAKKCQFKDLYFFDMPMTGSRPGAESGQLLLLVGGSMQELNKINKDLRAIAKDIKYFGPVGSGTKYKLILNTLQAIHLTGFGEVLRMAEEAGLDKTVVGTALSEVPGGTTTNLAWKNYQVKPDPINFSIGLIEKDLRYSQKMTKNKTYVLRDDAQKKFQNAVESGHQDDDWTTINQL